MVGGTYGGLVYCDAPVSTLELMLQDAKSRYAVPDFILLTGDLPPHDVWYETEASHMTVNALVSNKVKQYFPTTTVYAAIGNHDSAPSNNFPPRIPEIPAEFYVDWLYNQMYDLWSSWLVSPQALDTVKKGAYYSIETVYPGLRVISINNNICYFADFWLLINATDPLDELKWLVQELTDAEAKQEKVILIMHIPPGNNDCLRVWSSNFYDIVNRFESTIVGQFSGHTHIDNFMVYYEKNTGRATNVMYVCPSLTPYENFNLAYRVYTMDGTPGNYAVLNHETYVLKLAQSNANSMPEFIKMYDAKGAYDMPSLDPSEWDNVITKIATDDKYWQRFFTYYHRNSSVHPGCDASCKDGLVCQLQSARSRDPSQCPPAVDL